MRISKQEPVNELPNNAVTVSEYSRQTGYAIGYIYIKHQRSKEGKATVNYKIVSFQGVNFVIPF